MNSFRRGLMKRGLSLSSLALLAGCDLSDNDTVQSLLGDMSEWNDRVQAAIFGRNAWYGPELAPKLDAADYRLRLSGRIADKTPWSVEALHALPQVTQITRHVCVEGWSMIGKWGGTPLSEFLRRIGADTTARYVGFECADGYYESIDMPTALHPQTLMAFRLADEILPTRHGFPFKLRMPTKLGYKNPKFVTTIFVSDKKPPAYWSDRGYNWFGGI